MPDWFHSYSNNYVGWEIFSWRQFFITIGAGNLEIQVNKYAKRNDKEDS